MKKVVITCSLFSTIIILYVQFIQVCTHLESILHPAFIVVKVMKVIVNHISTKIFKHILTELLSLYKKYLGEH